MARMARLVQRGFPYHVTHRGNRRADVFSCDSDRNRYLGLLGTYAERYGLDLWAYSLMSNHVHLIVRPQSEDSMALAIGNAHRAYSRLVNEQHDWTGHLWAGRYYSTLLDEEHLWSAVRYVELNPVRAGLVLRAVDYPWSSAAANARLTPCNLLDDGRPFPGAIEDWSGWLQAGLDEAIIEQLRSNTTTGRPSVGPQLLELLERGHGRLLHPGRRGRRCRTQAVLSNPAAIDGARPASALAPSSATGRPAEAVPD